MTYLVRISILCSALLLSWGCTQKTAKLQRSVVPPDQTLYETGTDFLKQGHYIRSRLALQTMINTYPDSEMTSDAYFAIGDSYYEEGGTENLLQAVQQYTDFIIFFPAHPKTVDAHMKKLSAYMKMMGSPDRDQQYTLEAEREAEMFLLDYPDHDYTPIVKNDLVIIRDKLALKEEGVGDFYDHKKNYLAAIGRYQTALDNYPNYYNTPEILYKIAEAYEKANAPEEKAEVYLARILTEYPDSEYTDAAKEKLVAMGKPIPEADLELAALRKAQMQQQKGFSPINPFLDFGKALGFVGAPDRYEAAKEMVEAQKTAEEKAAAEKAEVEKAASGDIQITDEIRKPDSEENQPEDE